MMEVLGTLLRILTIQGGRRVEDFPLLPERARREQEREQEREQDMESKRSETPNKEDKKEQYSTVDNEQQIGRAGCLAIKSRPTRTQADRARCRIISFDKKWR